MIDIHTHIIPGFDDGSVSLEMTREMLKQHLANGVSTVVATPHQNKIHKDKVELINRFNQLVNDVKDLPIKLLLGSEIYYYDGLIADLKNDLVLTMTNSKYVLIEFSTRTEINVSDVVYDIVLAGFKPIIAHIERYGYLKENDYNEIKNNGALIQVNAHSFEHREYKKTLAYLLKNGLVDFVASDCHNTTTRNVDFTQSKKLIQKKFKQDYVRLFETDFDWSK